MVSVFTVDEPKLKIGTHSSTCTLVECTLIVAVYAIAVGYSSRESGSRVRLYSDGVRGGAGVTEAQLCAIGGSVERTRVSEWTAVQEGCTGFYEFRYDL